ncbi:UvrB/UvrC motif-containing protein [Candidatus Nomurabacteria bacterium]|nr:UvrB/UvrC motif-containing protein [Candidatus Nomurabacteria bacterium]
MKYESLKKSKLPDRPGVYFFLKTSPKPSPKGRAPSLWGKAGDEVLYVGKATSLKDRVKSYFGKDLIKARGPLLVDMVFKADRIDWQEADSVLEALILEANLIKKHQPKYNTKEKSDKSFLSVVVTAEALPRVLTVRSYNLKGSSNVLTNFRISKTYGPFTSGTQLKEALKIIRPIFPFLDDKSKNYYKFYKQVNLVPDISTNEGIKKYKNNIKNLKLFFEGKKKQVLKNLEKEMKLYVKVRKFEKAGEIKRQIFALKHINDVALLKLEPRTSQLEPNFRIEAYDIAHMSGKNMTGVMVVVENGEPAKNEYRKFRIKTQKDANDIGALTEVLERRLVHKEWRYPDLVVVDGSTAQINAAKKVFAKTGKFVSVVSVVKDERHKPKAILGDESFTRKYKKEILLANSEAHRFAIAYHKDLRGRNFLP